jgi:hypothetical protein
MSSLSVPIPILKFEAVDPNQPNLAVLEKPIEVRCSVVQFPNGTPFEQKHQKVAGFLIYRRQIASSIEIWDAAAKQWISDPGDAIADLKLTPFAFKSEDKSQPWLGLIVPAAQKDTTNKPQFVPAGSSGFPQYFFRAYFASNDKNGNFSGFSSPSLALRFTKILDAIKAGIAVGEGQTPADATEIQLFLRNSNRQIIGSVEIIADGNSTQIEIANRDAGGVKQAIVRLLSNGDLEIQPALGRQVKVSGAINGDRIFYQPADAGGNPIGSKRWLS